jgi:hypothetical protein
MEWASNSIVCANSISNYAGIMLMMGHNNTFYANHLENNTIGIRIGYDQTDIARQFGPSAANNIVFHNNFVNNTQQGVDYDWLGTNHWDNGKEGNYWSDYNGTDMNSDGIGDTPYTLSEAISFYAQSTKSTDRYPLIAPFDISSITIQLPEWAYSLPSPSPTPELSPSPTPNSPSSPSPSPSLFPTPTFTSPNAEFFQTTSVMALVASVAVVSLGLLIYFKKRNR